MTKMNIHFDQRNLPSFAIILSTGLVVSNETVAIIGRLPEFAPVSILVISVRRRQPQPETAVGSRNSSPHPGWKQTSMPTAPTGVLKLLRTRMSARRAWPQYQSAPCPGGRQYS